MLLANHGALTVGPDLMAAYYKMETIEHFAKISLVARMLGRENLITRDRKSTACRGCVACTASSRRRRSAPIRLSAMRSRRRRRRDDVADCQIVQAPSATGTRLWPT